MDQVVKLLRELIALPSVNPAFLPVGSPHVGEQRVAEFLAATGARWGLDVDMRNVAPSRPNLFLRLGPSGKVRTRLILAPHLDTAGGEPLSDDFFKPREHNGRLYGRGACDTKGCVAAMLTALQTVAQSPSRPAHTEILFIGLVDEENAQAGSRAVAASGLHADLAIVGEPTRLQLVTAHKGSLWLRLTTRGRAAHGSRPELGINAIHSMARVVQILETEYAEIIGRRTHPVLRPPTINVGCIYGGRQVNVVPAQCDIKVDRRMLPGETETGVRREILALLRRHHLAVEWENFKQVPCLPLDTNPSHPLIQQLLRISGSKNTIGVDYFSDASVLSHGGIPSVIFGPGDIAQAHTANEWISLKSLERGTAILTRFLQSLP